MEDIKVMKATEQTKVSGNVTDLDTQKKVYVLKKPFEYEGKKYEKLEFDFESLIGQDMVDIENEMAAIGEYVLSPEISTSFLLRLAGKAAGVGSDVIAHLPIRDFGKIKNMSRDFLVETGLQE